METSDGLARHSDVNLGRILILTGLAIAALGVLVMLGGKLNLTPGRLPGDILWRGRNSTVYVPWATCLLLSLLATLVVWLLNKRS